MSGMIGRMSTQPSLDRAVREVETHVARYGWDGPVRLFALVRTESAAAREPGLLDQLTAEDAEAAAADPGHLLLVEQDGVEELDGGADGDLERILGALAWPVEVDGVAVTVERLVVPPDVEAQAPADPDEALRWLAEHPRRHEVRIAAGVLRDGARSCVIRTRGQGEDEEQVVGGPDLVPGLTEALGATLVD